jgi:uncharacterized paraquat-inducible protein A
MASTNVTTSQSRLPERLSLGSAALPAVDALRSCGCGQALDTSLAEHCPRCGVELAFPVLATSMSLQGALPCRSGSQR